MKKIFLILVIVGAIGVIGTGILENSITVETQDMSKFPGASSLTNCVCEDPQNPGSYVSCDLNIGQQMCNFP